MQPCVPSLAEHAPCHVEEDVQEHKDWTERRTGKTLSDASIADLQGMLSQLGILQAIAYDDEPPVTYSTGSSPSSSCLQCWTRP